MKYFFVFLFFVTSAQAIEIFKIREKKVLLNLQGSQVKINDQLLVISLKNKKVAILKVISLKNDQAVARITNGSVRGNEKIVPIIPKVSEIKKTKTQINPAVKIEVKPTEPRPPIRASFMLGLASNTLSLKVSNGVTSQNVDNTGNSIGISLAAERQYFKPWLRLRGLLSYEQFNAIGAATINGCANKTSKDCQTDIKYLSFGGYFKYEKEYEAIRIWSGAGLHLKTPISKSSTALDESSLGSTMAYGLTLGADYTLESKNFMTFSIEKQMFLKSDSAETNTLFIRIGAGKEF